MISSLHGRVLTVSGNSIVIDVGGVGFFVNTSPTLALAAVVGHEISVFTSLIVREDALTLFGFLSADELDVFELLIGVNGVGPKSALGVLSVMTPDQIAEAVTREEDSAFRKVSGIGPKTAKLIVVSLTGKLVSSRAQTPVAPSVAVGDVSQSVVAALTGLGWSERIAQDAVAETLSEADDKTIPVPTLLRLVLARLGPAQQHGNSLAGRDDLHRQVDSPQADSRQADE